MNFVLLLVEVDLVSKKRGCKSDMLMACGSGHIEIILVLTIEIVVPYVQTLLIQVRVLGLEGSFLGNKVYLKLVILLALEK